MNVLVINGHPRNNSLSEALANAYADGASEAGTNVQMITVAALAFDVNVTHYSPNDQYMEPAIHHAQKQVAWADHVVFVYPTWWGTMPALLKGFIDRVFTSGFAFQDIEGGTGYAPLLRGKTAQVITTMDTPVLVYKLINKAPGDNAMQKATLGFCGFELKRPLHFGPVKNSDKQKREQWLNRVKREGLQLQHGVFSQQKLFTLQAAKWLKAIRLQFYPMSFMAYTVGALAATPAGENFQSLYFWLGYLWLFLLEVATVLSNEYFDYKTDVQNKFFSMFSGGSRVIVEKLFTARQVKYAFITVSILAVATIAGLILSVPYSAPPILIVSLVLFIMALGYTLPPLRLAYQTMGEITVGLTHSVALVITGFLLQGGNIADPFPWFISIPLFFAVLPSITLAGIPDRDADKAAGKKTLAVRFGNHHAATIAIAFTLIAVIAVTVVQLLFEVGHAFNWIHLFIIPHAALLWYRIRCYQLQPTPRVDMLLVVALTFILWFVIIPMINLW